MFGVEQRFEFLAKRREFVRKDSGFRVGEQSLRNQQRHELRRAEPESRQFEGYPGGIAITLPANGFDRSSVTT